jgi:hypothetical protein
MARLVCALTVCWLTLAAARPVEAQQVFESVGIRALGMAGAFVAVADDGSAPYWNPAGLATAGPVGATIGWNRFQNGDRNAPPVAGPEARSTTFVGLGTWPLGVSYGRFESTALVAGDQGKTLAETLQMSVFGGTVLQSVARGVVVGSTLKLERGFLASGPVIGDTAGRALSNGAKLDGDGAFAFDFDIGAMVDLQKLRLGLTTHNLREPTFTDRQGRQITLQRQSRAGVAFLPTDGLTLAMDVDLDTVDLRDGLRRMIAMGVETRPGQRIELRAGIRWNLEGERRPVGTGGVSVELHPRVWLEGYYAQGRTTQDQSFGVGLRAGY